MCSRRLLLTFVARFFYIFWLYIDSSSFVQSLKTLFLRPTMSGVDLSLPPGFRFHPTDEELVKHYLCRKCTSQSIAVPIISDVDLYKHDPWQLPGMSSYGEKEWYFFSPRDRKYPNGSRPNRAAGSGYWKATGADKPIGVPRPIGIKKALVFYVGKAPKGEKTNWIMHEYRLANVDRSARKLKSLRLDDWVLCRIYKKGGGGGGNRKTVAVPGSMKAGWMRMPNLPKVENDSTKMHTTTPTSLSYNTTPQIEPGPAIPQPQQLMISDYMYLDPLVYSATTSGIFDQFSNDMRNINAIQSNQQLPTRMRGYNNGSSIENLLPPTTAAGSGEQRFSSDSANQTTTTTTTMPSIFRDDKMLQDVFTFLQKPF